MSGKEPIKIRDYILDRTMIGLSKRLTRIFEKATPAYFLAGGLTRTMRATNSSNGISTCRRSACFFGSRFSAGLGGFVGLDFGMWSYPQGGWVDITIKTVIVLILLGVFLIIRRDNKKSEDSHTEHINNIMQIEQRYLDRIKKVHESYWYSSIFDKK